MTTENLKVLYITNYPMDSSASAAIRNRSIIEGLKQCGCSIYTLTRKPQVANSIKGIKEFYFYDNSIAYKVANKVKRDESSFLWKLRVNLAKIISKMNIYDNQRVLIKNLDKLKLDVDEFDFVISSSDSKVSHLIVDILIHNKTIKASKWIQYWGDPFYADINEKPLVPTKFIRKEEERVLNKADYIFYTSPFTLRQQKELFVNSAPKMHFIPTPYIEPRYYESFNNKKYTVGYYGSYFKKDRNLMPLYNVANKMKNINFEFIGSTDLNFVQTKNILVKPQVSSEEILNYEAKCDLLICVGNKSSSHQIPGKLYHFAATNKPILFIYEKGSEEIANFFSNYSRYYFCENDTKEIEGTLKQIMDSPSISASPIEEFKSCYVARKVLEIING